MKGIPGAEGLENMETKLSQMISLDDKQKIISFEENEFLEGIHFLSPIYNYIKSKQVLDIEYKAFKTDEILSFTISPYYLKQFNKRWYLFGWNNQKEELYNLPLDRMQSITPSQNPFISSTIDFDDFFDEIIGVTNFRDNEVEKIKIQLSDHIIPYIKSKPLHSTQKLKGNIVTIEVKQNYELESLILSYGENMTVLEPLSLAEKLAERVFKLHDNYVRK